jgi:protein-serine/threonine kinase
MYEILIGRTPFEAFDEEEFENEEQLMVYYRRMLKNKWLGEWSLPHGMILSRHS